MAGSLLEMHNITKRFSGIRVLHNVNFCAGRGEIVGLVGANGAGKSTLMKVLSGVYPDYEGDIKIDDNPVRFTAPLQSIGEGIGVVYQEFSLVNTLTVAENILLGREPRKKLGGLPFLNWRGIKEEAQAILGNLGFTLSPSAVVGDLGVADQQLVQIAKTMASQPKILVMDEPTARLSRNERDNLFRTLIRLRDSGTAIVYISHFLDEVFMIASRITVLRDGCVVKTAPCSEFSHASLVYLMLGHAVEANPKRREGKPIGRELLSIKDFSRKGKFSDINLRLCAGEILGITGLVGSGRTEFARALFGADCNDVSGGVLLEKKPFLPKTPYNAIKKGVALVPEDRKQQGLVLVRPVGDNIAMAVNDRLTKFVFIDEKKRTELIERMVESLEIKTAGLDVEASTLSGGNQQKVVLAKWLATDAKVLILDQPTAGIDIGTKDEIYKLLELLSETVGIIVISDDPEEITRICDRVLVMRRGKIVNELSVNITNDSVLAAITSEAA